MPMQPTTPKLAAKRVIVAKSQPPYLPIEAALVRHPGFASPWGMTNAHVVAFQPTPAELEQLNAGEAIYLSLLTFGGPMTPIIMTVGAEETAAIYNVEVERG